MFMVVSVSFSMLSMTPYNEESIWFGVSFQHSLIFITLHNHSKSTQIVFYFTIPRGTCKEAEAYRKGSTTSGHSFIHELAPRSSRWHLFSSIFSSPSLKLYMFSWFRWQGHRKGGFCGSENFFEFLAQNTIINDIARQLISDINL